jgi:hypothetical protein
MTFLSNDSLVPYSCPSSPPDVGKAVVLPDGFMILCGGVTVESAACYLNQLGQDAFWGHPTNMSFPRAYFSMVLLGDTAWVSGGNSGGVCK